MKSQMEEAYQKMMDNWQAMKKRDEGDAEEVANQFEASFYQLIDRIREWLDQRTEKPRDLDECLAIGEIRMMMDALPAELLLNFETELEYIIDGQIREEDARVE